MNKKVPKLCFVSSSGGHWEQLQKLKPLADKYEGFFVTEKTQFDAPMGKYFMCQTDLKDKSMVGKMLWNTLYAIYIWLKEKPDFVMKNLILLLQQGQWLHIHFIFYQYFFERNLYLLRRLEEQICPLLLVNVWKNMLIYLSYSGKLKKNTIRKLFMEGACIDICNCRFTKLFI